MGETGLKEREEHHADTTETKVVRRRGGGREEQRPRGEQEGRRARKGGAVVRRWCSCGGLLAEREREARHTRDLAAGFLSQRAWLHNGDKHARASNRMPTTKRMVVTVIPRTHTRAQRERGRGRAEREARNTRQQQRKEHSAAKQKRGAAKTAIKRQ